MKKAVALILMLCIPLFASAHTVFRWKHFGAAPYATTHVQAMRTRESALHKLGLPHQVVVAFMKATKKPGKEVRLVNGDHLSVMLSRGGVAHRNVLVDFTTPPISGKMEYAAPAEEWQISWRGKTYTLLLPRVCNNWSIRIAPASSCVSINFHVKPGVYLRYGVFTQGRRLPSTCWKLSDGDVVSATPSPCTVCNWVGVRHVLPSGFVPEYTGLYVAHARVQTLWFPREVTRNYIVLCVTQVGKGESDSWVVPPSAWETVGTSALHIPYGNAQWPVWGTQAIAWSSRQ